MSLKGKVSHICYSNHHAILCLGTFVLSKVQWVPTLLEPPAHTHINYVVTDLHGGPKPPAPVEDSYRRNMLTVSRCVLWCGMQSDMEIFMADIWACSRKGMGVIHNIMPFQVGVPLSGPFTWIFTGDKSHQ